MKKFLVVLMALLFAGSAFAQDAAPKGPEFKYGVWANAFAVTEQTEVKDVKRDYSEIRVKPTFTMGIENVSVVTAFEIDQYFGKGGSGEYNATTNNFGNGSASSSAYADSDTDQIAVEVKWAYINVKDFFIPGLTAKAGLAPFVYSVGYNNDMPQFNLVYDAGIAKIDLAYVKVEENGLNNNTATGKMDSNDVQMFSAKLPVKIGDITIAPAMLYAKAEKNHAVTALSAGPALTDADLTAIGTTGEFKKMMPSIALAVNAGAFSFNADFVYIKGESKDFDTDFKAYAGYANAGFKASDMLSINVFGMYTTGQDDSDDITSFQAASGDEFEVGPLFIVNDGGFIGQVGVSKEYDKAMEGLMAYGLAIKLNVDKFGALAQVAYATTTSDDIVDDKAIGTEFDLRLTYEVAPKTNFWVEGAYLMGGKYIETKYNAGNSCDDPMYYAAGLMTSI